LQKLEERWQKEKKDDNEEAEMRRLRRKLTKRIAPISNLLTPEMIEGSSEHEIMKQSGENRIPTKTIAIELLIG
jgi:hypothetical protein